MPAVLDVAPAGYRAAATAMGESVAGLLRLAWGELCLGLDDTGGMGGSDDAGASWADGYDRACASAGQATTDVVNASFIVASLLDQTGINYGEAEAASMPGGVPVSRRPRFRGQSVQSLGLPPSALGGDYAPPGGWNELARRVDAVWPNGHQDRLRAAAHAWTVASDQAYGLLPEIDRALADLGGQHSPEAQDVQVVLGSLRDSIAELAASWRSIGRSCADYAHHLDEAHHALIAEVRSFLEWTAVIEGASALFSVVTAGLSAIGGQAAEARWIAACAARVHSALDALKLKAATAAATVLTYCGRLEDVSLAVRPLLARDVEAAKLRAVSDVGGIPIGRKLPTQLPGPAATTVTGRALSRLQADADAGAKTVQREALGHSGTHQFPGIAITTENKSQFFDGVDLEELANTDGLPGLLKQNGNRIYVKHANEYVGVSRATRLPTRTYTVVRGKKGQIITMYPGTSPKS